MKFVRSFKVLLLCVVVCPLVPLATTQVTAPARPVSKLISSEIALPTVDALVQQEINRQQITGAVLLIGHNGRIVHRKAFGFEAVSPRREPTTPDTVYDLASLTKVVATTPSVMHMVETGQIRLNDPVAHYIPEFAANGKDQITIRDLMTHYSGLRPDLDLKVAWEGREEGFRRAHDEKPIDPPGARFVYSDINFLVLGEIVELLSEMSLEKYAH